MEKQTFNADSAFAPIEITLGGKTYQVVDLTPENFDKVAELSRKSRADGGESLSVLCEQLAILTGEPADTFKSVDIRKMAAAIKFISDEIKASGSAEGKA